MRILFLTQYFPPEVGAAQNRIAYLAKHLAAAGHTVMVFTSVPSYPLGEVFPGYLGKWLHEEHWEGVHVVRVRIYVTKSKAFFQRLANYFSFALATILVGISKSGKQDAIIVESPPLFLGLSGLAFKFVKKAKLAFNVSDLWPESAVALGVLRNRLAIRCATYLEELIYKNCDLITGQTRGIVQNIQERILHKQVALITNGAEISATPPDKSDLSEWKRKFGWQDAFLVGYTGLHGLVHGLETVVEAAAFLACYPEIRFVFFGDGPDKEKLVAMVHERGLRNLTFYPYHPKEQITQIIACFDVAVIPLRRLELLRGTLPAKMFESMGAGVPVVASLTGESKGLIEQAGGGICVPPEDSRGVADAILRLFRNPQLAAEMGARGRQYVLQNFNRKQIADSYDRLLREMLKLPSADLHPLAGVRTRTSSEGLPND